jgi:hypothetical protein
MTTSSIDTNETAARAKTAMDELKTKLAATLTEIEGVRDDLRVRIHLAGMDLRDAWATLETRHGELTRIMRHERDEALAALEKGLSDLRDELHALRTKLDGGGAPRT